MATGEKKQLINLHLTAGQVCVWHPEEVDILRRKHHIVGSLIGALPSAPRQNAQQGLPLQLMPEEAAVLLQHGVARLVTMSAAKPSPQRVQEYKQRREDSIKAQKALWIEHQSERREQLRDVIEEGKRRKKEKKVKKEAKISKTEQVKEKEACEVENLGGDRMNEEKKDCEVEGRGQICERETVKERKLNTEKRHGDEERVSNERTDEGKEDDEGKTGNKDGLNKEREDCEMQTAEEERLNTERGDGSLGKASKDRMNEGIEGCKERLQGSNKVLECSPALPVKNGNGEFNRGEKATAFKVENDLAASTHRVDADFSPVQSGNGMNHDKAEVEGVGEVVGGSREGQYPEKGCDGAVSQVQSLANEAAVPHDLQISTRSPLFCKEEDNVALEEVALVPPILLDSDCLIDVGQKDGEMDEEDDHAREDDDENDVVDDVKRTASQTEKDEAKVKESGCSVQLFTAEPLNSEFIREAPPRAWHYPSNEREELRYRVFLHFWEMGYFITSGTKFGGDFLVYPGDPFLFHSYFIVVCVPFHKQLTTLDLVSHGRLGTFVKKTVILCSLNRERRVITTSLQWSGIS